ncbi:MAG: hypothetical protein AAB589_02005 [Patescibacteria group bacterium]
MKTLWPKTLNSQVKFASQKLGVKEDDLLKNALTFYLSSIAPYLELKTELQAWDKLSDEALVKFEQSL